jgi:Arc/MetJ family transcription regulator
VKGGPAAAACDPGVVLAYSDDGVVVDAEFSVESDGPYLEVILESRGGALNGAPPRNPDYTIALELLIARLAALGGELLDAHVDSATTRALPVADRRILDHPVQLDNRTDVTALRMDLGRAAAAINRTPNASGEGNRTKRVRLVVAVPGFEASQAALLATVLSRTSKFIDTSRSAVEGFLRELIGTPIPTASGTRTNTILGVDADHALVATSRTPSGQQVPILHVVAAMARLKHDGIIDVNVDALGYRSAFVGAVLLQLPGARISGAAPPRISIIDNGDTEADDARSRPQSEAVEPGPFQGALDRPITTLQRREQRQLRAVLLRGRDEARCALCGETYPARFLWASHIKKRSAATATEARDLPRIAMLACVFGCDALFEDGYVSVGEGVVIGTAAVADESAIKRRIDQVRGRAVEEYGSSATYFDWHRDHVFRS